MNATLKYMYAWFEQIKLKLKKTAIGNIALRKIRLVTRTRFSPSSKFVVYARRRVAIVANIRCHVVRKIALDDPSIRTNDASSVKGEVGEVLTEFLIQLVYRLPFVKNLETYRTPSYEVSTC